VITQLPSSRAPFYFAAHDSKAGSSPGALVKIGLVQMRMSASQRQNIERAARMIRRAAAKGAKVICLPELYRTRYFPRRESADIGKLTETVPGESTQTFSTLAGELDVVLIVPIYEMDNGRLFNTACVIDANGELLGKYRKIHIPHDPSFYEASYFESGDLGYQVFESKYLRFATLICYDQWFPEAARIVSLKGAEVIFYPSAVGHLRGDSLSPDDWRSGWETVQRSHAIANGVHVAALNRVGAEGEIDFWGGSFVCDAFGRVLGQAAIGAEDELVAEIDLSQNREIQEGWGFRVNRHPESYASIVEPLREAAPVDLGLSMPAEWEPHSSTWLAWPYDRDTFDDLPAVEQAYVQMIRALHTGERVDLLVRDASMRRRVSKLLESSGIALEQIAMHVLDYADVWIRDYGPTFLVNRSRTNKAAVDWEFNAWGGKYEELLKDGRLAPLIMRAAGATIFDSGIVLEGGAIDSNGAGTILTTEQCLLDPNRNPGLSAEDIEKSLKRYLGATKVIWLKGGIDGDDTDGHVDTVARFVGPQTVVCADPDYGPVADRETLAENFRRLCEATDQNGQPLEVIKLPMPEQLFCEVRGERQALPATYLNFYIGNSSMIVPVFGDGADAEALELLAGLFPGRSVAGIDAVALLHGLGAFHCVTQQEPSAGR
jgi:agmatine deiminase